MLSQGRFLRLLRRNLSTLGGYSSLSYRDTLTIVFSSLWENNGGDAGTGDRHSGYIRSDLP